ncbi:12612_t:CDS:2 [Gigaspora margarita]|uniref:12612_t:CDS:1 n=1 Tax=Gigaspora margarita TaxID=4874 RepID=A0ABN7UEN6_GIGMA|nr:12612_t:CDS:2 [Gigaspora margarita]
MKNYINYLRKNICNIIGINIKNRFLSSKTFWKEKEDALSTLISNIELPSKQDNTFRSPLKGLNQPLHLLPHINTMKEDPTLDGGQRLYKHSYQNSEEDSNGNVVIKNYYINTDNVTIN